MLALFFNQNIVESSKRLLDTLQDKVKQSHKTTYDRVTKDFKSPQQFSLAQYVGAKFKEAGFGYSTNDTIIRRCAGPEQTMQTLRIYGGNNFREAYINKFVHQYEHSKQRRHELHFDTRDSYKAEKEGSDLVEEQAKNRREQFQKIFGNNTLNFAENSKFGGTWDKIFKRKGGYNT